MSTTSVTNPTNPVLDVAEKVLRSVLVDFLMNQAMNTITAAEPWLLLPFINPLFRYFFKKYYMIAYKGAEIYMTFAIIDEQVEKDVTGYKEMKDELHKALQKPIEEDDSEETRRIEEEYDKKLRDLIHFNR